MAQPSSYESRRDRLAPETTLGIAALFVAVAGLARTIGGVAAAITAAAVGVAIATLLAAPLVEAWRRRGRAHETRSTLPLALLAALVALALVFSGLFVYDAVSLSDAASTRDAIRATIVKSFSAELSWYQDPMGEMAPTLEKYFVAPSAGGERLAIIEAAVARLRRCERRIGTRARSTTFVSSISVSGDNAEAHAVQSLYQPVFDKKNGRWIPHPLPPASLSFSVPDQLYLLHRMGGRWKVQSAPQPQNLGPC